MTEEKPKAVAVRMSPQTKAHLEAKAKEGFRTLNREILLRLEESVKREREAGHAQAA